MMIIYSEKAENNNNLAPWVLLSIDFILCMRHTDGSVNVTPHRRVLLLPEARRHPSTSFVPLWAPWLDPGTDQHLLHLHHPSKASTSVSSVPGAPG